MRQLLPRTAFNGHYAIRPSLGDAQAAQTAQQIGSLATPAVTGIIAAHAASVAAATGSSVSILGMSAGLAVPVIGAALMGATLLASWLIRNSGCGQTCVVTSQWANQAERMLKDNIAAYFALPIPRPAAAQQVALANFDAVWKTLEQQCGQPGTGDAGIRCISDRESGACKWKQTTDSILLQYPGEPQPGECWNWWNGYRDPIAKDTNILPAGMTVDTQTGQIVPDTSVGTTVESVTSAIAGNPLLLIGGAALILFALTSGGKH